jgi:glycosyltransferase involved in cell wall biosynthesis
MISLILTVLNEKSSIEVWFESIYNQSVQSDEIIVVDGGSSDGTWDFLQKKALSNPKIKVFQKTGNIAVGRNYAIQKASGTIIVVADAGCIYDKKWFEIITEPFLKQNAFFATTAFGPWFKEGDSLLVYAIASSTTPAPFEFSESWMPSSRSVAFLKEVWQSVGGYPEWLPICEDVVFDKKIMKKNVFCNYIRTPLVMWRPRTKFVTYFKQLMAYTKGDGHAKLFLNRQIVRYVVYGGGFFIMIVAFLTQKYFFLILLMPFLFYLKKFFKRWFFFTAHIAWYKRLVGLIYIPMLVILGDISKMIGWVVGVYERLWGKIIFEKY